MHIITTSQQRCISVPYNGKENLLQTMVTVIELITEYRAFNGIIVVT